MKKKLLAVSTALLVLSGLGIGAATASVPAPDGTINGCRNNLTHALSVRDSAASCPFGTTSLNFSQTGPEGPTGVQGPVGPRGTGKTFYNYMSPGNGPTNQSGTINQGQYADLPTNCNNNGVLLSGGYRIFALDGTPDPINVNFTVLRNGPEGNPNDSGATSSMPTWVIRIRNDGPVPFVATDYANCLQTTTATFLPGQGIIG